MMKINKAVSFLLVIVLILSLCACGGSKKPHGKYEAYYDGMWLGSMEFSGNHVIDKILGDDDSSTATFEVDGDKVFVHYDDGSTSWFIYDSKNETLDFEGRGSIVYEK